MSSGEIEKIEEVRPSVFLYAKDMENRLREKDEEKGKDGWHDGKLCYYLTLTADCVNRIFVKIAIPMLGESMQEIKVRDIKEKDIHLVIKKCIDGGNFFMMLADNLRDELIKRGGEKEW